MLFINKLSFYAKLARKFLEILEYTNKNSEIKILQSKPLYVWIAIWKY